MRTKAGKDQMLATERRKLEKAIPGLMAEFGLVKGDECTLPGLHSSDWHGWSYRFGCEFRATFLDGPNPWLATRFHRELPYGPWKMSDPRNLMYADIDRAMGGDGSLRGSMVNPYSGKFNCHLFGRLPAEEVLHHFKYHLKAAGLVPEPEAATT